MRRQCCYLHDNDSFIEKVLRPINDLIPHYAQGVTSIDAETYCPRGIFYGYEPKFLNYISNLNIEDIPLLKKSFELGLRDGYNTATTESFGIDVRDDPEYKNIYGPYGFKHGLQTYFFSEAGSFLGYSGLTKKTAPGYTDEDIKIWEQVAPYVLHAFRKYRWLVNIEFFNKSSLEDMMFAAILTDRRGKVRWSNSLAKSNIPELATSDNLPDGLKPCFKKVTGFFQEKHDPFIYREMEASTPYGSTLCFAVDESSSKYLPLEEEGVLFVINSDYLNKAVADSLTNRERETLSLIANGKFDKEIADILNISTKTVSSHVGKVLKKLKVSSRAEAAVKAVKLGIT